MKNKIPKQVTETGVIKRPLVFHSRVPLRAQSPVVAQHPTVSNSIAASVQPFGKPLGL